MNQIDTTKQEFLANERRYKLSLHQSMIDKPDSDSLTVSARGWIPRELTVSEFIDAIRGGFAYAAQYKHGHRTGEKFLCSNVLSVDIDEGQTIDEALENPFIKEHAAFIYTTPSHTSAKHRFRIVFLTDQELTDKNAYASCLYGLTRLLSGDKSATDAARMFFGNKNAEVHVIGNVLSTEACSELVERGAVMRETWRLTNRKSSRTVLGRGKMLPDTPLKKRSGEWSTVQDLPVKTSVFCPFHPDTHASAFTIENIRGCRGICCKACDNTFWCSDPGDFDFFEFDRLCLEKQQESDRQYDIDLQERVRKSRLPLVFGDKLPSEAKVENTNTQYLSDIGYQEGLLLVKSPKGSGKTEALKHLIESVRSGHIDVPRRDMPLSVLVIGHRRILLSQMADRLEIDNYQKVQSPTKFYAITLDSLSTRIKPEDGDHYDVVIIDECEQVLRHLRADTLKKPMPTWLMLARLIKKAKLVVCLDADMSMLTVELMGALRPEDWSRKFRIINNKAPVDSDSKKEIQIFDKPSHLKSDMMDAIRAGKRIFVACNSKNKAKSLRETIKEEFGETRRIIVITSEKHDDDDDDDREETRKKKGRRKARKLNFDERERFIRGIKTEILKYDVTIASPALGTGVDITFEDNAVHIDVVYGFFNNLITTHTDIDQQLARVRHPGEIKVWIDRHCPKIETDVDLITRRLARVYDVPEATIGWGRNGEYLYDENNARLRAFARMDSVQWSSFKFLADNFIQLRRENGWIIKYDHSIQRDQRRGNRLSAKEQSDRKIKAILNAETVSLDRYQELAIKFSDGENLSRQERRELDKAVLENAFGLPASYDLVSANLDGKLFKQVALFKEVKADIKLLEDCAIERYRFWESGQKADMLCYLFGVANLLPRGEFETSQRITKSSLQPFVDFIGSEQVVVMHVLGVMRQNYEIDPVKTLNQYLDMVGLRLCKGLIREYSLDESRLKWITDLSERYVPQDLPWIAKAGAKSYQRPVVVKDDDEVEELVNGDRLRAIVFGEEAGDGLAGLSDATAREALSG